MQLKSSTTLSVMFQMLCAFSTRKRVRSLCLALLCLWLTLVSCFFSLWSLDALPSYITRFSTPGSTTAFSLHPDPWHPPTCTSFELMQLKSSTLLYIFSTTLRNATMQACAFVIQASISTDASVWIWLAGNHANLQSNWLSYVRSQPLERYFFF